MESYSSIVQLKKELDHLLSLYHSFVPEQTEYDFLWPNLDTKIRKTLTDSFKKFTLKPKLTVINSLEDICTSFDLVDEKVLLQEVRQVYEKQISTFEEKITSANRLSDLNELTEVIEQTLEEGEDKSRLLLLIESKVSHLQELISSVQELTNQAVFLRKIIIPDDIISLEDQISIQDLSMMEETDLVQKKLFLQQQLAENKTTCYQLLQAKLTELVSFTQRLEESQLFSHEELFQLFDKNLNLDSMAFVKKKKADKK